MRLLLVVGGLVILTAFLTGCVSSPRFTMGGDSISGSEEPGTFVEEGVASYYAEEFNGRTTSNGEVFDSVDIVFPDAVAGRTDLLRLNPSDCLYNHLSLLGVIPGKFGISMDIIPLLM